MFTHLHTHTEFSLLDGMTKMAPLMERVKALGMESVAMTDHGAMYGTVDFYREARERGLKPIVGVEAYVAQGSRHSRERGDSSPYHLIMLARDMTGYKNLISLVTKANLEGYYYKPRIDRELMEQHSAGITVLSGCPSSEFHRRIQEGDREGAVATAKYFREIFDGHYYLEVQDHGDAKFSRLNPVIADIGREMGIPVVATNDSHYTLPEEAEAHDVLLCIGTNSTVDQQDRFKIEGTGYYVKSEAEMLALFPSNPEFISNTELVAKDIDLDLHFDRQLLPEPPVPEGRESGEYLAELCFRGLHRRFDDVTPELQERLAYELDVLKQTGFTDYIYVVKEIADFARKAGIRMGVRGSAAASLVLYVLDVTDIDPVANRLVFERFLNIERREMPDVDFDFADDRRDEMIRFAYERYGSDRVAQIITFGTLGAKAAIRDVGRALGMSYADTDRVARLVPERAPHHPRRRPADAGDEGRLRIRPAREAAGRHRATARRCLAPRQHPRRRRRHLARPADRARAAPAPQPRGRDEHPHDPVRHGPGGQGRPPEDGLPRPLQPHHPPARDGADKGNNRRGHRRRPPPGQRPEDDGDARQGRDLRRVPA